MSSERRRDLRQRAQKFLWTDSSGLPRQVSPGKPACQRSTPPQWLRDLRARLVRRGERPRTFDVEVRLWLPVDDLDELTDRLMEMLLSIGAQDVTMGGSLASGEFEVSVTVEALDLPTAQHGGLTVIGEALEAAGAEAELRSVRVSRAAGGASRHGRL